MNRVLLERTHVTGVSDWLVLRNTRSCSFRRTPHPHHRVIVRATLKGSASREYDYVDHQNSNPNAHTPQSYDYLDHLDIETRITVQIATAGHLSELHSLLCTGNYLDRLTQEHASAMLVALPRTLEGRLIGQHERCTVQQMLQQLNGLIRMHLHRLRPAEIACILEGLAALKGLDERLQCMDSVLLGQLVGLARENFDLCTPQQLSALICAGAKLGVTLPQDWLGFFLAEVHYKVRSFTEEDHARTLKALAQLADASPPLRWLDNWLWQVLELKNYRPEEVSDMLWAAAKLGFQPFTSWLDVMVGRLQGGMDQLGPRSLADSLWAVASMADAYRFPPGWLDEFWAQTSSQCFWQPGGEEPRPRFHAQATPAVLATIMASCGKLGVQPPEPWLASFLAESSGRFPMFGPEELANTVWGLAMLECAPHDDWLQRFVAEADCQMPTMNTSQMARIIWALNLFQHELC